MYEEIKAVIADVANVDESAVTHDVCLKNIMDSLSVLEVMLAVESKYGIKFEHDDVCENTTMDEFVRYVKIKVAKNV